MQTTIPNPKMAASRSFVRSLNILLKFVRLYGLEHARSAEQFQTAWSELRAAIPMGDQTGLLLGAAGSQLVLDGMPIEGAHAERSFAQLLSSAGLASTNFLPKATQDEFARFVRAFPTGNTKASVLAEQLKSALADAQGIRINEVRYVAEDSSAPEKSLAATLAAKTLGMEGGQFSNWLNDPQKLLQLITAAEGSRGGSVGGSGGGSSDDSESGDGGGSYYSGDNREFDLGFGEPGRGTGSGVGGWFETGSGLGAGPGPGGATSGPGGGTGVGGGGSVGGGPGAGGDANTALGGGTGSASGIGTAMARALALARARVAQAVLVWCWRRCRRWR